MPNAKDSGLWLKPGMFFSVSETSKVKEECAKFINWFVNSNEANSLRRKRNTCIIRCT